MAASAATDEGPPGLEELPGRAPVNLERPTSAAGLHELASSSAAAAATAEENEPAHLAKWDGVEYCLIKCKRKDTLSTGTEGPYLFLGFYGSSNTTVVVGDGKLSWKENVDNVMPLT